MFCTVRPKSLSQSTLAKSTLGQTQIPLPESLGGGYEPLPEYSGRALQSEDYHLTYFGSTSQEFVV